MTPGDLASTFRIHGSRTLLRLITEEPLEVLSSVSRLKQCRECYDSPSAAARDAGNRKFKLTISVENGVPWTAAAGLAPELNNPSPLARSARSSRRATPSSSGARGLGACLSPELTLLWSAGEIEDTAAADLRSPLDRADLETHGAARGPGSGLRSLTVCPIDGDPSTARRFRAGLAVAHLASRGATRRDLTSAV